MNVRRRQSRQQVRRPKRRTSRDAASIALVWREILASLPQGRARAGRLKFSEDAIINMTALADELMQHGYPNEGHALNEFRESIERGYGLPEWRPLAARIQRAVSRMVAKKPAPQTAEARRKRVYIFYRRRGFSPSDAVKLARRAENIGRVVGHVGDVNWPAYDGGPILRTNDGYMLEYVLSPESNGTHKYMIFRTRLDREPIPSWINVRDVANFSGMSPSVLRQWWRSRDVRRRAAARETVASYHGWENLDQYPLNLTKREVYLRYRRKTS